MFSWFSQDFRHEVNLLVKLRHPNIVQFLGAVTERKPLMLITEYLRGVCILMPICAITWSKLVETFLLLLFLSAVMCFIFFLFFCFKGDLHQFLKEKGSLSPSTAVNFALDIARYPSENFQLTVLFHVFWGMQHC